MIKQKTFEQTLNEREKRFSLRAYEVKTAKTAFFFNGDWRQLCRLLKTYGYKIPLSMLRALWRGQEFTQAGPVSIKNLCYLFGTM
jgi:hypothetical protein